MRENDKVNNQEESLNSEINEEEGEENSDSSNLTLLKDSKISKISDQG